MSHCSEDACQKPGPYVRSMCSMHYTRWRKANPPETRPAPTPRARNFWAFVDKADESGCWTWTGKTNRGGYGTWAEPGFRGLAHRKSYQMATGELPDDMFICHTCDNPPCVNPAHLYAGTHQQNMTDAVERDRTANANTRKTHCKNGHELGAGNVIVSMGHRGKPRRACRQCTLARRRERETLARRERGIHPQVLNEAQREEIRQLRREGHSYREIAARTHRAYETVAAIAKKAAL